MDVHGEGLKKDVAARWTFGVSVVAALAITVIKLLWMIFSLPSDDNGGGMVGAIVVSAIEFVVALSILEVVRRVFLRFIRLGSK
jgi:hypothetical protein